MKSIEPDPLRDVKERSRRVAETSLASKAAESERRRQRNALPEALSAAVNWGSYAKQGEQTLDFVRHLRIVVAQLRHEGAEPSLSREGLMPDLAREMLKILTPEPSEFDRRIADWLHQSIVAQSIDLDDWMHQRPVPSFDDLPPADRIHYFRDGIGDPPASLWGDLAVLVGIEFDGMRQFWRRTGADATPTQPLHAAADPLAEGVLEPNVDVAAPDGAEADWQATHSEDFTTVNWFGTRHRFTKRQAQVVALLWAEWERGKGSLSEQVIGDKVRKDYVGDFRLRDVFRKKGETHAAWGTMIVPTTRGVFALNSDSRKEPR